MLDRIFVVVCFYLLYIIRVIIYLFVYLFIIYSVNNCTVVVCKKCIIFLFIFIYYLFFINIFLLIVLDHKKLLIPVKSETTFT